MAGWTHETICMGPTGNAQGSYKFYCLWTKQKLTQQFRDQNNSPYPDIPKELLGVETQENHEGVTPAFVEDPDGGEVAALPLAQCGHCPRMQYVGGRASHH